MRDLTEKLVMNRSVSDTLMMKDETKTGRYEEGSTCETGTLHQLNALRSGCSHGNR